MNQESSVILASKQERLGFLVRLWRWLFGGIQTVSPCHHYTCHGYSDPRCKGRNCTEHCSRDCSPVTCLEMDLIRHNIDTIRKMGHEPHDLIAKNVVVTCRKCSLKVLFDLKQPFDIDFFEGLDSCDNTQVRDVMDA